LWRWDFCFVCLYWELIAIPLLRLQNKITWPFVWAITTIFHRYRNY
jgi:hypothetical protein